MELKITKKFTEENRNRKFWAIWANGMLVATYVWSEQLADMLVDAVCEYGSKHGNESVIKAVESANNR